MASRKKNTAPSLPNNIPTSKYGKEFNEAVGAFDESAPNQILANCRGGATSSSTRSNTATSIPPLAQFSNIWENSVAPYPYGSAASYGGGYGTGNYWGNGTSVWINQAIQLVQAAYTHIPQITSTINLLTELCVGKILLRGGTAQSRSFFNNWLKKINIMSLQSGYYLEDWRSGNMFYYKLQATLDSNSIKQFNQAFGSKISPTASGKKITIGYMLLNPGYIGVTGTTTFISPNYYKILNPYEISMLLTSTAPADVALLNKVPELKQILDTYKKQKNNGAGALGAIQTINLPLTPEKLAIAFSHKQDYEALSVPPFYRLMPLLNRKIELQKIDQQINRQILRATLLITMGDEALGAPSPIQTAAMQSLFNSDSIAQVIVGDYTIKGQWLVPAVGELFDPKKYTQLDKDIDEGLGNILLGDGKYSSASAKLDVFIHKINYHREMFLNDFLIPQMEEIAAEFGFKNIPTPEYEPLILKENATKERIYAQMAQLGLLTSDELVTALETGVLPDNLESIESQTEYKELRDKGMYMPLVGGPKASEGGRPGGSTGKQTTQKVSPAGTVGAKFDIGELKNTILRASRLEEEAAELIKKKFNVKKLNKTQNELVGQLVENVVQSQKKDNWSKTLPDYIDFNEKEDKEVTASVNKLAIDFETTVYNGALMYHSLKQETQNS